MAAGESQVTDVLKRLEGFTVAMATPLTEDFRLDVASLERLVERIIAAGARGILVLGWFGEGPMLRDEDRLGVIRETVRAAAGRVVVVAGVAEHSLSRSVDLADQARKLGADVVLSTPPYSYGLAQDEIYQFYQQQAEQCELPIIVYYNKTAGVVPDFPTMARISEIPGIIGVKASCPFGLMQQFHLLLNRPGRFAAFASLAFQLGPALFLGIRHLMTGAPGNLSPKRCVQLYEHAVRGDWEALRVDNRRMIELCTVLFRNCRNGDIAVKFALSELGLCQAHVTPPMRQLSADEQAVVRKAMIDYKDVL